MTSDFSENKTIDTGLSRVEGHPRLRSGISAQKDSHCARKRDAGMSGFV